MIPPKAVEKLNKRIEAIGRWRYDKIAEVPLEAGETNDHFRTPPVEMPLEPAPIGSAWGRPWGTVWFHGKVEVPRGCRGRRVYYRHVSAAERLLFVNGAVSTGMNHYHQEALLLPSARGGEQFDLWVEAYSGHEVPEVDAYDPKSPIRQTVAPAVCIDPPLPLEASELVCEREAVAGLYYDARVLYQTALILPGHSRRRAVLLDAVNQALDLVPMHWATGDELEAAAKAARKRLAPLMKLGNAPTTPLIGLVGHAHIDVAWLWPLRESIRKAARTFSSVLALMDAYPEFRYIQSQPVLYEMIEEHYPELLPRIRKRVKEGRWEPNGGMWVEADSNVSGGEALVRQFLEGRKKTQELFGYTGDTLWLPDVFGYSAAMPQILAGCGINNFVTSKINWNDTNRFPYDTFLWRGIDGTEMFTHYISCVRGGYNAEPYPETLQHVWERIPQKELNDRALLSIGWGDGGGGPTREMLEHAAREKDLEGCPKAEFINVSEFLEGMRERDVDWPRWVGELYFELHRGTYTSQARTKRYNRKLEVLFRETECLATMAMDETDAYPHEALQTLWRSFLTHQFHDILPGSSIAKVYEDAEAEYARIEGELTAMRDAALDKLGEAFTPDSEGNAWLVANTLAWPREDIVYIEAGGCSCAVDAEGAPLRCQQVEDRRAVLVQTPGIGVAAMALRDRETGSKSPFKYAGKTLETPHYRVQFDKAGKIASLFDIAADREVAQPDRRLNDFYTAEDMPMDWDAWDIDLDYRDRVTAEDRLESREMVTGGPLMLTLRSRYALGRNSSLVQDMTFYAHSRRIDFKTEVDWNEKHTLLKVGFPVDVHNDTWRNEIQFGHLVRNRHMNTSWDSARFEVCAHKWVDLSEADYGVALLNDCKYGHDTLEDMVSLTLLKSATGPDPGADEGTHTFTYALLPHAGGFCAETVVREAYALNAPLTAHPLTTANGTARALEFCAVDNPNVVVEAVKKAENDDAVVVRVYEANGGRATASLAFARTVRKATECNLLEDEQQSVKVSEDGFTFSLRPFEIKTFKVHLR